MNIFKHFYKIKLKSGKFFTILILLSCLILATIIYFSISNNSVFNKILKFPKSSTKDNSSFINSNLENVNSFKTSSNTTCTLTENVSSQMLNSDFWIKNTQNSSSTILSLDQIKKLNKKIISKVDTVYDLENYSLPISKSKIISYISKYKIPTKTVYTSTGNPISKTFYSNLIQNLNKDNINDINKPTYGISLRKTNLRSFPTDTGVFSSPNNNEIDHFQESSCEIFEPVIILHTSLDKKWYFIQMYNYRGWVNSKDIALVEDKNKLFNYVNASKFLIVTGNHINATLINNASQTISFNMGNKLVLADKNDLKNIKISKEILKNNYIIKIPYSNDKKTLSFKLALVPFSEDVHLGYIPYTKANVLIQAFKLLGDKYDWGNKYNGRDCSSFIISVYSCMGFKLPRNTDDQELIPTIKYNFSKNSSDTLNNLSTGDLLYMNNHVVMYLGLVNGIPYIIHNFTGYANNNSIYQVAVTSANIPLSSGKTFLTSFTTAVTLK